MDSTSTRPYRTTVVDVNWAESTLLCSASRAALVLAEEESSTGRWERGGRASSVWVRDNDRPARPEFSRKIRTWWAKSRAAAKNHWSPRRKHAIWQESTCPRLTCAFANTFREFTCFCASTSRQCLDADERRSPAEFGCVFGSLSDERVQFVESRGTAPRSTPNVASRGSEKRNTVPASVCLWSPCCVFRFLVVLWG